MTFAVTSALPDLIECNGYDKNGIRRVYGLGSSRPKAKKQSMAEARIYIRKRPDTGPLSQWSWTYNQPI